ncbi:UPF0481-like protein [Cinnamomum micranthum f. kanehirae]|uniref:UPF0481-like protein n=1 Tax=Cinnamomum micranthum f. kanehirae TaxID=337451 RepID=A0A3S3M948_9MAGN|nr:UPF0481-like protein [Cinnamomum micranthum f. kanehirae]
MTTGTRDDVRIPISEEPENLGWLYKIIEEPGPRRTSKPLIQTVAQTLRGISRNKTCFDPSVVSFGPYHHGKDHLKPMERCKEVAALWFIKLYDNRVNAITREEAKQVYDEFVAKVPSVSSLRDCYTDKFVDKINDADFMRMMFLDGCFMLNFIQLFLDQSSDPLETSHLTRPLILRDMFLLENQIPYSVLVALKSLKPSLTPGRRDDWAASFFKTVFLPPPSSVVSSFVSHSLPVVTPLFLIFTVLYFINGGLDWLFLIFGTAVLLAVSWYARRWICRCLCSADSRFEEGTELQTEPLHLLDLLRSELTGKGVDPSVHGTRYGKYNSRPISELKAAGIQELRSSNIMLNRLGSDEEVVNLFRELATNLSPDFTAYSDVTHDVGIDFEIGV